MISLAEINRIAEAFGVAAETIEKDYMISWILLCLSKSTLKDNFVFYGGTAIKRMYFEDHRFSEDLDFWSESKYKTNYILEELNCLNYAKEIANINFSINIKKMITSGTRILFYVDYEGYDEIIGAPKEIRLDFTMDLESYGRIINKDMIKSYSDLKHTGTNIPVMSLNTILANKMSLLIDLTRNEPRDLFDIWFLLERTDKFDFNFKEVCETYNERMAYYPSSSILIPRLKNILIRKNWKMRLEKQIATLPNIEEIISGIENKLIQLFEINPPNGYYSEKIL